MGTETIQTLDTIRKNRVSFLKKRSSGSDSLLIFHIFPESYMSRESYHKPGSVRSSLVSAQRLGKREVGDIKDMGGFSRFTFRYRKINAVLKATYDYGGFFEGSNNEIVYNPMKKNFLVEKLEMLLRQFFILTKDVMLELESPQSEFIAISLTNVQGYSLVHSNVDSPGEKPHSIEAEDLFAPVVKVEDITIESLDALRPVFDEFWRAFGYSKALSYAGDGSYIGDIF